MIQLHAKCLLVDDGVATVPCNAEAVAVEVIGDAVAGLSQDTVRDAALAVLHYFKHDLGREQVTLAEFAEALERVLRGLGFDLKEIASKTATRREARFDLRQLAASTTGGFEMLFFQQLRVEICKALDAAPEVLQCDGLRACVKQLIGARRWNDRCRRLNDQIVDYLRECLHRQPGRLPCALVVR